MIRLTYLSDRPLESEPFEAGEGIILLIEAIHFKILNLLQIHYPGFGEY